MLTQDQIEKLEKLTIHPKYGTILEAAIVGWKRCKPESKHFGISAKHDKFCRDRSYKGCCLIGASLLNKKVKKGMFETIIEKYFLNIDELWSLIYGFDKSGEGILSVKYEEAYKFGKSVREVLGC